MVFEECKVNANYKALSDTAAAHACRGLGLPSVPPIRFFTPSDGEPVRNGHLKGKPFEWSDRVGSCNMKVISGEQTVWIRSGLSQKELIVTVAHEIYHYAENLEDYWAPGDETAAETYGQRIYWEMTDWRAKLWRGYAMYI